MWTEPELAGAVGSHHSQLRCIIGESDKSDGPSDGVAAAPHEQEVVRGELMDAAVGIGEFFGSPVWQGIGVLATMATGMGGYYLHARLRAGGSRQNPGRRQSIRSFDMTEAGAVDDFYDEFFRTIRLAKEQIYRSGSGFDWDRGGYYRRLLQVEEEALVRGVEVTRIQTSPRSMTQWADGLADLLERYPNHLRAFADFDRRAALDFGLVDPHGSEPLVCLYLEEPEATASGVRNRTRAVVFFYNHRSLAAALAKRFMARVQTLSQMTPTDVRGLGQPQFFFAYGPHMLARHTRQHAPNAIRYGRARLRGWRLELATTPLPRNVSVRIERTDDPNDSVDGVVYEISEWEKQRLTSLAHGTHREVSVNPERGTGRFDAFAIVHDVEDPTDPQAQPADLLLMIEGAKENENVRLVERLHRLSAQVGRQGASDP
jgi:hypothetical protein